MHAASLAMVLAASCWLAGCTGLAASAALADCNAQLKHVVPPEKDVDLQFHLILETADHQRMDVRGNQSCHYAGLSEECRFSTRGSNPTAIWKDGPHPAAHRFTVKGRTFTLEFPDCKTALAWRLPADRALPKSVEDVNGGDGFWKQRMGSIAYRFVIRDESGKALEGTPMSDYVMANYGFKVVWATIR